VPNPHWHGALLNDRCWYVVGWFMGLGIALGLLLLVDIMNFQHWFRTTGGGVGALRNRLRRIYGGNVAIGG
jgi:hypothetical protein